MRNLINRLGILAIAAILAIALTAVAQDTKKAPSPEEMQKMMQAWQKLAAPGAHHNVFKQMAGNWTFHMKMAGMGEDKPMESDGTAHSELVLDGRYVQMNADGMMMNMPFKGMGTMGYDNFKNEYQMTWIDNMGTTTTFAHGTPDATGKVITLMGKMDEPMTGEKDKDIKYVWRFIDNDHHVLEAYDQVGTPKEFKAMEIAYTRVK